MENIPFGNLNYLDFVVHVLSVLFDADLPRTLSIQESKK